MPFLVSCQGCKKSIRVPDNLAGRIAKCPKCGQRVELVRRESAMARKTSPTRTSPSKTTTAPRAKTANARKSHQANAVAPAPTPQSPKPQSPTPTLTAPTTPVASPPATASARSTPDSTANSSLSSQTKAAPQSINARRIEILQSFRSRIEPVIPPPYYHLGVLFACAAMLLLPLVYVSMIVGIGRLTWWHMTANHTILAYGRGRGKILIFLIYVSPILAGVALVGLMLKPIFSRRKNDDSGRSLTAESEPILFAFVNRICEAVGAPTPKRIDVNTDVNASASFRRGLGSVVAGDDLVLTIGMPLVATMNMRQFGGILAHEFGHFSQGAGMRLSYIVRSINHWFMRVVYERDKIDDILQKTVNGADIRLALPLYIVMFCVWIVRRILWLLMMCGHLSSSFLLRQMEFDADRYETRLVGSKTFESTCHRLTQSTLAHQSALGALSSYYQEGKLGDNLPRLIENRMEAITPSIRKELRTQVLSSKTGWLDTHPCDQQRIASAYAEDAQGVFAMERPASDLFVNYEEVCKGVTWDLYRCAIDPLISPKALRPIDEVIEQTAKRKESQKASQRFLLGAHEVVRPFEFPSGLIDAPKEPAATLQQIKQSRQAMQAQLASYESNLKDYQQTDEARLKWVAAKALFQAQVNVDRSVFVVKNADQAEASRKAALHKLRQQANTLATFERIAVTRLESALRLLHVSKIQQRVPDAKSKLAQAQIDFTLLRQLSSSGEFEKFNKIYDAYIVLGLALSQLQTHTQEPLVNLALRRSQVIGSQLKLQSDLFRMTDYPFDHADRTLSLGQYLVPAIPQDQDVVAMYEAAGNYCGSFVEVRDRLIGRLCQTAEAVETAVGLPKVETPEADVKIS